MIRDSRPGGRRDFFRDSIGQWLEKALESTEDRVVQQRYQRPPGALSEMAFLAACTRCGECVSACPPKVIQVAPTSGGLAAGTPFLDIRRSPCIACPTMPCVQVCPTEALTMPERGWDGYRLGTMEFLPERCVTFRGQVCRACADACPQGEKALVMDEAGHPVLRQESCVGCGVCIRACISVPPSFGFQPAEAK
jgi:ferredoxin-type protein NapG/ferredoxin-type protein NapH